YFPIAKSARLPDEMARVLARCDGRRTVAEIAADLPEVDVFDALTELEQNNLLRCTLEVPTHAIHPDLHLRGLLEAIPDPAARGSSLAALDELCAARDAVASAAGD